MNNFKTYLVFLLLFFSAMANSAGEKLEFMHYTNEDGLPSSYIKSITQDQFGFIWMATRSSVCRFDGKHFKIFKAVDEEENVVDLWGMQILFIPVDSLLLVQTTDNKYYAFDFDHERFEAYDRLNSPGDVDRVEKSESGIWYFSQDTLYLLELPGGSISTFYKKYPFIHLEDGEKIVNIREKSGRIVALTSTGGMLFIDPGQKQHRKLELPVGLKGHEIVNFYLDRNNFAWLGAAAEGLYRINLASGRSTRFSVSGRVGYRLLHDVVHSLQEDYSGNIWIGTEDGLCIWSPYTESFDYYQYDMNNPEGLNTNPVYNIFCDRSGNMWLGTYFGGVNLWSSEKEFFHVWKSGAGRQHLSGNAVSCITEDAEGNIWIGTEDKGINCLDVEKNEVIRRYSEENGLSFDNVHDLLFLSPDILWIGTYTGGINILDVRTGKFLYINRETHPSLPSDEIYKMLHSGDSMFITTSEGVVIYDLKTGSLSHFEEKTFDNIRVEYLFDAGNRIWLSSYIGIYYYDKAARTLKQFDMFSGLNNSNFVKVDSKGRLWVGDCLQGLWGYDFDSDSLFQFSESNGFPFSWIFSMEESKDGSLWISGDKGLVKLNVDERTWISYDRDSGLPFEQFNFRASYRDSKGGLYFGSNTGLIAFDDGASPSEDRELKVVFRGMKLFNQDLKPGSNRILDRSLNQHPVIHLKYRENVFTIEYAGLHFENRGNCHYAYYMENFEDNWNYVGNRDFASYTNLSPGEYYFHVKASSGNTRWGEASNTLKIIIDPPFWLSGWAYFIYTIIAALLLLFIVLVITRVQRSKAQAEMERRDKENIRQLNQYKLEFFTNISHELRTPLTLIVGPVSSILEDEKLSPGLRHKMKGIKNNSQRLLALINRLLDFRKVETGKEKLKVSSLDINSLLTGIKEAFENTANSKGIHLHFEKIGLDQELWIDGQKLENILVNLLSNALKFTGEGGEVEVLAELVDSEDARGQKNLRLSVSDTGVGMEEEQLIRIFDRFYGGVSSGGGLGKGSGIGLAFTDSLVKLHKGVIDVSSKIGEGSRFIVLLPVSREAYTDEEISSGGGQYVIDFEQVLNSVDHLEKQQGLIGISGKQSILVIDDNRELLEFITETLSGSCEVITAENASEALKKLDQGLPDIIISDVMMPGMNGFELTHTLKSDLSTSHIPVVLLTAKGGHENEFEGLKSGADYYIEKPFLPHILKKIIENILTTRNKLIERFRTDMNMLPTEMAVSESDKNFIEELTKLIKERIDIPELDVPYIVNEMGISRSHLHVKLKKLTDCSATEFIRTIRLKEAVRLIADGQCNISEAAYKTGFSSPAYFTQRFKEHFGVNPKAYFEK